MTSKPRKVHALRGFFMGLQHTHGWPIYDPGMRYGSWLGIVVILLKLSLGSVMALPVSPHAQGLVQPVCHGQVIPDGSITSHESPTAQQTTDAPAAQFLNAGGADCHPCCATGLGGVKTLALLPAPAARPQALTRHWLSASLRPDLRPPIG